MDLGQGFFVGVKLDEPFGNSNGVVNGVKYFEASDKFAVFVRPNALEIGDFPELDIDDEIWCDIFSKILYLNILVTFKKINY